MNHGEDVTRDAATGSCIVPITVKGEIERELEKGLIKKENGEKEKEKGGRER